MTEVKDLVAKPMLPHQPATSLGGVESLIEHRILSDAGADPCLSKSFTLCAALDWADTDEHTFLPLQSDSPLD